MGNEAYQRYLGSSAWKEVSDERKSIDGYKCVCCGREDNLNVHHVVYPKNWEETTVQQLRTLCHDCHVLIHRIQEEYDKYSHTWKFTADGRVDMKLSPSYPKYEQGVLFWLGEECWKRNLFTMSDVTSFISSIIANVRKDKRPAGLLVEKTMRLLAFAKDCYTANNAPAFDRSKRKERKQRKTRFK